MDIENTMQFIVNQQAQFVADIHQLRESQRELQESQRELGIKVDKLHGNVLKLHEDVFKLHEIVKHHNDAHIVTNAMVDRLAGHLEDFVERQGWFFDGHKLLLEAQQALFEAQLRTEATVEKLADKMEHFIDEVRRNVTGGNGRKGGGKGKK